jgi:hypothetical protein
MNTTIKIRPPVYTMDDVRDAHRIQIQNDTHVSHCTILRFSGIALCVIIMALFIYVFFRFAV